MHLPIDNRMSVMYLSIYTLAFMYLRVEIL